MKTKIVFNIYTSKHTKNASFKQPTEFFEFLKKMWVVLPLEKLTATMLGCIPSGF